MIPTTIHQLFKHTVRKLQNIPLPSPPRGRGKSRALHGEGVGLLFLILSLLSSCARMGRPDGGWYDETPPHVVAASPADGGTNVTAKKVRIYFDEFIKLENASEKVVVSPPQLEQAEIKASGKRIDVELKDSLRPNTTYTIDFSDAISDNNEGNPMGNYTYSFSTGDHIDTLEVSGTVISADNLEPVKGILVGLYDETADSCFRTKPLLRVSRTDSRGRFVIKGVASGSYRIYALNDQDGDYRFSQKSEQIAFAPDVITPSFCDAIRQDTTWLDSLHIKDIQRVGYTRFTPDDIVLRAFTHVQTDRFFLKAERAHADHFALYFSYGADTLPSLRPLNFDATDRLLVESSAQRDTITYWLRDTTLVNQDTLNVAITYQATDTLGNLATQTDTLQILSKQPYEKRLKQRKKDFEEWKKKEERKRKRGEPYDSIMPQPALEYRIEADQKLDPDRNISFEFDTPLAIIDTTKIHLYAKHDTLWYTAPLRFEAVKTKMRGDSVASVESMRRFMLRAEWRPDIEYSLEIDSTAFTDIYGYTSKKVKKGFKVGSLDDYSTLMLNITQLNGQRVVVELLSHEDKTVKRLTTTDGLAQFFYVTPGKYYARLFVDSNNNGVWDTGDYDTNRQPEAVFYYPEEIECKAKWDVTLNWNPTEKPLDQQKPDAIKKQKGEQKRKIQQRNMERAKKLGIAYPF